MDINNARKLIKCLCQGKNCTGFMGITKRKLNKYLKDKKLSLEEFKIRLFALKEKKQI